MPGRIVAYLSIFFLVFTSCVGSPSGRTAGTPDWVRDPYTRYNSQQYVAAVGNGNNRQEAEISALAALVSLFGREIRVDDRLSSSYQEALRGSVVDWSEVTTAETVIALSAGMDALIGAEIGDAWDSQTGSYYAVAILNKQRAIPIYTNMINANLAMIENLTNMTEAEKNTLTGYARYQFAATIADVTVSYWELLSVIGGNAPNFRRGDAIRIEAMNIITTIPVDLAVQNDRAGRIQDAFARSLSSLGFRSGGTNSPYLLNVNVTLSPVDFGNNNRFARIEVNANLMERSSGTVIIPYNFNLREGHISQSEADNRAYAQAERRINNEYANLLNTYLSQLLPNR